MDVLKFLIPKGKIFESVIELFHDVGIQIKVNERTYRPVLSMDDLEVKIMKPQNIPAIIGLGTHDVGFTGLDWVEETKSNVVDIMDLGFDPVRIVAAAPEQSSKESLKQRKIVVASEYVELAHRYLEREQYQYVLLRTHGATEVFPPDDADMIIDNSASGRTLVENHLRIIDTIMESSTHFIASPQAMENPEKMDRILEFKMLFEAVMRARGRVILEMNVPKDKLEQIVKSLPCMRSPTVSPLFGEEGYAVKIAVSRLEVPRLVPQLKRLGATDILEYDLRKVVL